MILMLAVIAVSIGVVGFFVANEIAYIGYQLEQLQNRFGAFRVEFTSEENEDE